MMFVIFTIIIYGKQKKIELRKRNFVDELRTCYERYFVVKLSKIYIFFYFFY